MDTVNILRAFISNRYNSEDYPTLIYQSGKWRTEQPLKGLRILDATPVFANTIAKYIPLLDAGAIVSVGVAEGIPMDNSIVHFLRSNGIEVVHPDCAQDFDIVLDCAGEFATINARIGYVELTRSGVGVYKNHQKPVYVADNSKIKIIETSLGTGDGYFRAMAQLGYDSWAQRHLVVFGNGKVGRGIAAIGKIMGAKLSVFDENSPKESVLKAIAEAYAIVTATGVKNAVSNFADAIVHSDALVANMGLEDEFGEGVPNERVLREKKPLNFMLNEPTHMKYIETTMALHNSCAVELLHTTQKGLIKPDAQLEEELLNVVRSKGSISKEVIGFNYRNIIYSLNQFDY